MCDAINNWFGETEVEQEEGVGKPIIGAFQAGLVFLIVKFFVGIATVEPFNLPSFFVSRMNS